MNEVNLEKSCVCKRECAPSLPLSSIRFLQSYSAMNPQDSQTVALEKADDRTEELSE